MAILEPSDNGAIRAAIDLKLRPADISDDIIKLDIYAGAADQDVLDLDPDAEGRSGTPAEWERIKRAAIYFCAARLCPAVVRLTSVNIQVRDMSYSRQAFDPEKRAAELRQMATEEIAAILTPSEVTPNRPTMFTVASGTRGL